MMCTFSLLANTMSVLLVDGQDEADRYNVGRPSMPERVFEPNVSVMEE